MLVVCVISIDKCNRWTNSTKAMDILEIKQRTSSEKFALTLKLSFSVLFCRFQLFSSSAFDVACLIAMTSRSWRQFVNGRSREALPNPLGSAVHTAARDFLHRLHPHLLKLSRGSSKSPSSPFGVNTVTAREQRSLLKFPSPTISHIMAGKSIAVWKDREQSAGTASALL